MLATDVAHKLCDGTMCSVQKAQCQWCQAGGQVHSIFTAGGAAMQRSVSKGWQRITVDRDSGFGPRASPPVRFGERRVNTGTPSVKYLQVTSLFPSLNLKSHFRFPDFH